MLHAMEFRPCVERESRRSCYLYRAVRDGSHACNFWHLKKPSRLLHVIGCTARPSGSLVSPSSSFSKICSVAAMHHDLSSHILGKTRTHRASTFCSLARLTRATRGPIRKSKNRLIDGPWPNVPDRLHDRFEKRSRATGRAAPRSETLEA